MEGTGATDVEILVVDNASSDDSAAIAERLAKEHESVRLLRSPTNRGYAGAVNVALPEARALPPVSGDDAVTFVPETGHRLLGGFRDFYTRAGGAAVLGFPITEELVEDGVTVQYFERAVLEYVPGQAQPVRAILVGDQFLREKGWLK